MKVVVVHKGLVGMPKEQAPEDWWDEMIIIGGFAYVHLYRCMAENGVSKEIVEGSYIKDGVYELRDEDWKDEE